MMHRRFRALAIATTACLAIATAMLGAPQPAFAIQYVYDNLDRVTKVTYDDGSSVAFGYDAAGNITNRTAVPEPAGALQLAAALATLVGLARRRRSKRGAAAPSRRIRAPRMVLAGFAALAFTASSMAPSAIAAEDEDAEGSNGAATAASSLQSNSSWLAETRRVIADAEYEVSWQHTRLRGATEAWQAPNRAHNLRTHFLDEGIRVTPRVESETSWELGLSLAGYGRGGDAANAVRTAPRAHGKRGMRYHRGDVVEWYYNERRGLKQGFTLNAPPRRGVWRDAKRARTLGARTEEPAGADPAYLALIVEGDARPVLGNDHQSVDFVRSGAPLALAHYSGLEVRDANGVLLDSWMEVFSEGSTHGIRLVFDDAGAAYPVEIDPLLTTPSWSVEGNQDKAGLGFAVAGAGDVNDDGFDDVLIGAPWYDGGAVNTGRAYLFLGSPAGLSPVPDWFAIDEEPVGGPGTGCGTQCVEGDMVRKAGGESSRFGFAVASAGDVDADGYADILVSRSGVGPSSGQENDLGRVFLYRGSPTGPDDLADWVRTGSYDVRFGESLAGAGDVDGDGCDDVVVGSPGRLTGQGVVRVFYGAMRPGAPAGCNDESPTGMRDEPRPDDLTRTWSYLGPSSSGDFFGDEVAGNVDVNCDGYGDIIVGQPRHEVSINEKHVGRVSVFLGKPEGLESSLNPFDVDAFSISGDEDAFGTGENQLGLSILGAEIDRAVALPNPACTDPDDKYPDDVLVGVPRRNTNNDAPLDVGAVFRIKGSPDAEELELVEEPLFEGVQAFGELGNSLALVEGLETVDVNVDGQMVEVEVDGYLVGQPGSDPDSTGSVFLFPGPKCPGNIGFDDDPCPNDLSDNPYSIGKNAIWRVDGSAIDDYLGAAVAGAGDVNGDGLADVVIGAPGTSQFNGEPRKAGRALLFHGTPTITASLLAQFLGADAAEWTALDSFAWIGTNGANEDITSESSPAVSYGSSPGSVIVSTGLAQDGGLGATDWDRDGEGDKATLELVLKVPDGMRTLRFTTQYLTGEPEGDPRDPADIRYEYGIVNVQAVLGTLLDLKPPIEEAGSAAISHAIDVSNEEEEEGSIGLQLLVEDVGTAPEDSALVLSRVFFSEVALPDYLSDPANDVPCDPMDWENPGFPDSNQDCLVDYVTNPLPNDVSRTAGTFSYDMTLLDVPGKGMPFQLGITYNSERDPSRDEKLGRRWSHSYYATVEEWSDVDGHGCPDRVYAHLGGGRVEAFEEEDQAPPCKYAPLFPGVFSELTVDPGGGYQHVTREKIVSEFTEGSSPVFRLAVRKAPNLNRTVFEYNGDELLRVTDTRGEQFLFAYVGDCSLEDCRLESVTTVGAQVRFGYGSLDDLISVTDPNGLETRFDYDEKGKLLQITDADGITNVRNQYEAFTGLGIDQTGDRVVAQFNARPGDPGQHTEFRGDAHEVLRREGGRETNLYDVFGRRVAQRVLLEYDGNLAECTERPKASDPWCAITSFEYDADGNPVESRDPRGVLTRSSFDDLGNLVEQVDDAEDWDGDTYSDVVKMTYDPDFNGLEDRLVQRRGQTTCDAESPSPEHCFIERREYDDKGNLNAHYFVDESGGELTKTVHEYFDVDDPHPGLLRATYDGNCPGPECGVFEYDYDALGYLASETDPTGAATTYANDNLGRRTSVMDARGNTARFTYDAGGRLLAQIDPDEHIISYTYDAQGNPLSVTQEGDRADPDDDLLWRYTYTPTGMLEQSIAPKICNDEDCSDPLYITTVLEYDGDDRLTAITDPLRRRTDMEYDAGDRLVKTTDPAGGEVTATYDSAGNRILLTGPGGQEMQFEYDAQGRLIAEADLSTAPAGRVTTTYDERGLSSSLTNARGQAIAKDYDDAGRLDQVSFSGGGYASGVSVSHTLDGNGNQTSTLSSDSNRLASVTSRSFDRVNRLTGRTVELATGVSKGIQYAYDEVGNLATLVYSDGYTVAYEYDAMNRVAKVCAGGPCPQPDTTEYFYDEFGNLIRVTRPDGSEVTYSYDDAGRLIALSDGMSGGPAIYSVEYKLDAAGRRISAKETTPEPAAPRTAATTFEYNSGNQLTSRDGDDGDSFSYDEDGNLISGKIQNADLAFVYDEQNQLVAAGSDSFRYDADGHRVESVVGGVTKRYVYDPTDRHSRLLEEYDDTGELIARYVYGVGLVSREAGNGALSFYHFDTRGSTVALTDASGTVTDTYAYAPYGGLSREGGSNATPDNPFKYNGRDGVVDDGNGLFYMRARYYAPELMRFIQKSPLARGDMKRSQSINRYAFVEGNPISYVDPTGDLLEKDSTTLEIVVDVAGILVVAAAVIFLAPVVVAALGLTATSLAAVAVTAAVGATASALVSILSGQDPSYWLQYTPLNLVVESFGLLEEHTGLDVLGFLEKNASGDPTEFATNIVISVVTDPKAKEVITAAEGVAKSVIDYFLF